MTPEEIKSLQDSMAAMKAENENLKKENDGFKAKPAPKEEAKPQEEEEDLYKKTKKIRQSEEDRKSETKRIESALGFNLSLKDFLETNKTMLPAEVESTLSTASKETYDTAVQRANAIRSSLIQSFFSVQENVDFLTKAQKSALEDFLKLTKNGKEDRAEQVYENIFEPALETMRKVKKAEELGKSRGGLGEPSSVEQAYKERLIKQSRKTHLGEKETA